MLMKTKLCNPGDTYIQISRRAAQRNGHQIKVSPDGSLTIIGYAAYSLYNALRLHPLGDLTSILRHLEPTTNTRGEVLKALAATERLTSIRAVLPPSLPFRIRLIKTKESKQNAQSA